MHKSEKHLAVKWAQERLSDGNTIFLDLETNGLPTEEKPRVDILQIAMVNTRGHVIFSSMFKASSLSNVSDFSVEELQNLVDFRSCIPMLNHLLSGKHIVTYNAEFDISQLIRNGIVVAKSSCAMLAYAQFNSLWNHKTGSWKWKSLPQLAHGSAHNAITDTVSLYKIVQFMAAGGMVDDQWYEA